jgi:hypothetical protein
VIAMSNRGLFGLGIVVTLIQVLIALGLLFVAYSDTFGLARITDNGEEIVQRASQLDQRANSQSGVSQPPTSGQLRALLQASDLALRQLGKLIAGVGDVLLIAAVIQLAVLLVLRRRLPLSRDSTALTTN